MMLPWRGAEGRRGLGLETGLVSTFLSESTNQRSCDVAVMPRQAGPGQCCCHHLLLTQINAVVPSLINGRTCVIWFVHCPALHTHLITFTPDPFLLQGSWILNMIVSKSKRPYLAVNLSDIPECDISRCLHHNIGWWSHYPDHSVTPARANMLLLALPLHPPHPAQPGVMLLHTHGWCSQRGKYF